MFQYWISGLLPCSLFGFLEVCQPVGYEKESIDNMEIKDSWQIRIV